MVRTLERLYRRAPSLVDGDDPSFCSLLSQKDDLEELSQVHDVNACPVETN